MQVKDINTVYDIELSAHRAPWSRAIFKNCLIVGYECMVLEVNIDNKLEVAGYLICRYQDTVCHVMNLCIAPKYQKKGLGQYLLNSLIELVANINISALILEVRPSNHLALALYHKMGFDEIDIKASYYHDARGKEDAIVLAKKL